MNSNFPSTSKNEVPLSKALNPPTTPRAQWLWQQMPSALDVCVLTAPCVCLCALIVYHIFA